MVLLEWLIILGEHLRPMWRRRIEIQRNIQNLVALQRLDHKVTRAVEFWVKTTTKSYIIEFVIELIQSFSRVEE